MKQKILIFFLLSVFHFGYAQVNPKLKLEKESSQVSRVNDTLSSRGSSINTTSNSKDPIAKIQDYLIISHKRDTVHVDTTLTIKKEYKFNYLRRDNFELLPFSNVGQTYNRLAYEFDRDKQMP
jgi:hypothetical protein